MAGDDVMVVVDGVRVRRDEADALGIKVPGASAPAPAPETDDDAKRPARKQRTVPNKQRTASNK
ncbi:hypothetical protein GCM10009592_26570 [Brachybacterium rhamnosum]|uniref:Preprotein translocase subunit YajC n=1 Tax=Brachybacterium rhamnosum TaxID=173361 RepID=A0ABW4PZD8_9MICO